MWGGPSAVDICSICGGDSSTCVDCDGVPMTGLQVPKKVDKCGTCDRDASNDCKRDCVGIWGGKAKTDACGVCAGNGSTCAAVEVEVETATPNAIINLRMDNNSNLTAAVEAVAASIGAGPDALAVSLLTEVTVAKDFASIKDSKNRSAFEKQIIVDASKLLSVNSSLISISSLQGGSVVIVLVVKSVTAAAGASSALNLALASGASLGSAKVSALGPGVLSFAIDAKKLKASGGDLTKALPLLNNLVATGQITGVSAGQNVFANLVLKCPAGFRTDADGGCARCNRGEEPNSDQNGCSKCTDRVTSQLQTWHSPIGAACELCPAGKFPNDDRSVCMTCEDTLINGLLTPTYTDGKGKSCHSCSAGQEPNTERSSCVRCRANFFSVAGACEKCEIGRFSQVISATQGAAFCQECETGRTGPTTGTGCIHCEAGYFSLTPTGKCLPCRDVPQPAQEKIKSLKQPDITKACPGGLPGTTAGVCPQPGIWIHVSSRSNLTSQSVIELLPCEAEGACEFVDIGVNREHASVCYISNGTITSAVCGTGNEGFMCATCSPGYTKIGGICLECPGFNYLTILISLVTSFGMAVLMLHKSTGAGVVNEQEIKQIWDKVDNVVVDGEAGCGYLERERVQKAFELTGETYSENQMDKLEKEEFGDYVTDKPGVTIRMMTKQDFVRVRSKSAPTSGFGIAIFFIQTLALIAKDASFFGAADILNLDAEKATGSCVSPLG